MHVEINRAPHLKITVYIICSMTISICHGSYSVNHIHSRTENNNLNGAGACKCPCQKIRQWVVLFYIKRGWLPVIFKPLEQEKIVEFRWKPSACSEQQGIRTCWGVSSPDSFALASESFALNVPSGNPSLEIAHPQASGRFDLLMSWYISCPYFVCKFNT